MLPDSRVKSRGGSGGGGGGCSQGTGLSNVVPRHREGLRTGGNEVSLSRLRF